MRGVTGTFWKFLLVIILGVVIFLIMVAFLQKFSGIEIGKAIPWLR